MSNDPKEFYEWGMAKLEREKYGEAIRFLQRAVAIRPDYGPAWKGLGMAWQSVGMMNEAEYAYAHARTLDVTPPSVERERAYTLSWHSPYRFLLPDDENEAEEYLREWEEPSRDLQERYHQGRPVGVDYDDPVVRGVYMLRYFPFYIEIIPHILEKIPREVLDVVCHDGMEVALYGCGAAPELLGLLLFLKDAYPGVRRLGVTCYDRAGWDHWQTHVTGTMAEEYWPGGRVDPARCLPFDILGDREVPPSHASLQTMQNCCTDLLAAGASPAEIRERVLALLEKSAPGSLFILADVAEGEVKDLFESIGTAASPMGEVLLWPNGEGERHDCRFTIPETVQKYLFHPYTRSGNRFYALVLRRRE
jgi:hypothetical protein